MKITQRIVFLGAALLLASTWSYRDSAAEKYCNSRFGFCLDYSPGLLPQKHISENNDGVALLSADGNAQVRASGYFNVMGWSVAEEYHDLLEVLESNHPGEEVKELEKKIGVDDFEVLLQVGRTLHYERTYLKGQHFVSMTAEVNRRGGLAPEDARIQLKRLLDETRLIVN